MKWIYSIFLIIFSAAQATVDVNVKTQFGAVGNGTTDDYTAIQNAINYVSTNGGGTIYFPACATGQYYRVTLPLYWASNVNARGDGQQSMIFNDRAEVDASQAGDMCPVFFGNYQPAAYDSNQAKYYDATSIVGNTITLTSGTDFSNFSVGQIVIERSLGGWYNTNTPPNFKPYTLLANVVTQKISPNIIKTRYSIDAPLGASKVAVNGGFNAGAGKRNDAFGHASYFIKDCFIHNMSFKSNGQWLLFNSSVGMTFDTIYTYGVDGLSGNMFSFSSYNNFNSQFWIQASEFAMGGYNSTFNHMNMTWINNSYLVDGRKPLIRFGENVHGIVAKNYTIDASGDNNASGVAFDDATNCKLDSLQLLNGDDLRSNIVEFNGDDSWDIVKEDSVTNSAFHGGSTDNYVQLTNESATVDSNVVILDSFYGAINTDYAVVKDASTNSTVRNNWYEHGSVVDGTAPSIFFSQYEMTPSGGQPYDEFYWLNTNNASLTLTGVSFPADAVYRCDISGYAVAGNPNIQVIVDGVVVGNIALNSAVTRIFSTLTSEITQGNHTVQLKLSNFTSGANHGRVGLIYFTQTTTATPPVYDKVFKQPLANTITNGFLTSSSFQSGHLRGFNLGSNGYNQSNANGGDKQAMIDMVATGANIARCFVEIERPSGDTYQFKSGELEKLDSTIVRAARYGYYVVPCLFADPSLNTDYWGNDARKASIAHLWSTITNLYKNNTKVAGYDLINEPRENFNYAEVIKFEQQMIDTIRTVDNNHVVMVECVDNDMFAMMLPLYQYSNVVYSPHGYSPLKITHQGVSGEPTANQRNKYPFTTSSSNLTAPQKFYNDITTQHNDVRTMTHRFHVPVFIGEFSCINWSPQNDDGDWTSTAWCRDNIKLLELEGWSWVYHAWRGDYAGWEAEIPSSYYTTFTFVNATPQGLPGYSTWVSHRSSTAPTIVMLDSFFALNTGETYYISNLGGTGAGTSPATAWNTTKFLQNYTSAKAGGNTYLFNSGETFYISLPSVQVSSNVTLGSYGTGNKPIISHFTWLNTIGWIQTATPNVWSINLNLPINIYGFTPKAANMGNVGILLVDGVIKGSKQSALNTLTSQWDYYSDGISTLYVYSIGNPSNSASAIACTTSDQAINVSDNISLQNLKFWGFGGTGIRAITASNVSINNCDVYEGGGVYLTGTTRYGAGISFDEGASNVLVTNCNISQQYEAGFTMQSHSTDAASFVNCSFDYIVTDSTESGFVPGINTGTTGHGFLNSIVQNNNLRNSGSSWSHTVRPKDNQAVTIYQDLWTTNENDLIFQNNNMYNPVGALYYLGGTSTDPRFTSRYDSICMSSTILIRKNFNNAPTPYTYTLATHAAFTAAQGYEQNSIWNDVTTCGQQVIIEVPQDPNDYNWFLK